MDSGGWETVDQVFSRWIYVGPGLPFSTKNSIVQLDEKKRNMNTYTSYKAGTDASALVADSSNPPPLSSEGMPVDITLAMVIDNCYMFRSKFPTHPSQHPKRK